MKFELPAEDLIPWTLSTFDHHTRNFMTDSINRVFMTTQIQKKSKAGPSIEYSSINWNNVSSDVIDKLK